MDKGRAGTAGVWVAATLGPILLTAVLVHIGGPAQRDYVFLYLGLVAVLGLLRGFWPALASACVSFLLVDFYFVPPVGTFTIADEQDIVNLLAFVATACVVGLLASRMRRALLAAESLARQLREVNAELVRLNREQAEAAQAEVRLTRSEQRIRALQEADQFRRDLLANVSHELRTPLGTILAESTRDGEAEDAAARFATIAGEARRLNVMVEDMLDMARIESGALELRLEPLLLDDALDAALERLRRAAPGRPVERAGGEGVEVLADWDRLGQILDNLLTNANRFGPAGTPIRVTVATEEPGLAAVRISDRGPGVAPALRDRLFERFSRGQSDGAERQGGTGLGLAIVKGLVETHAGTVTLESSGPDSGATFKFTLPLAEEP